MANLEREMRAQRLVPKVKAAEAEALAADVGLWVNFAKRIQHNPAMRQHLLSKQQGRCPVCHAGLETRITIHHVSYINSCVVSEAIEFPSPTPKRPERSVKAPPCAGCPQISRCASYLALVHDRCHVEIHSHEGLGSDSR